MFSNNLFAEAIVGSKVPDLERQDLNGKSIHLKNFASKIVVLEWSSPECPYSRRYFKNGTLDSLYDYAEKNKIVWINIVPKLQTLTLQKALAQIDASKKIVIMDTDLAISNAYGATTTPQILIINKDGILSYSGAIDSSAMLKRTTTEIVPYTRNALEDLLGGREVRKKITRPFGCFINSKSTEGN